MWETVRPSSRLHEVPVTLGNDEAGGHVNGKDTSDGWPCLLPTPPARSCVHLRPTQNALVGAFPPDFAPSFTQSWSTQI